MSEFVRCGQCGTVYDMHGTHGTTVVKGYCPMCGLHHSGTHSIVYPVLKPSPLAAKPIDVPERTCRMEWDEDGEGDELYPVGHVTCSACGAWLYAVNTMRFCPNCGARVVSE